MNKLKNLFDRWDLRVVWQYFPKKKKRQNDPKRAKCDLYGDININFVAIAAERTNILYEAVHVRDGCIDFIAKGNTNATTASKKEKKERYLLVIYCVCSTDLEFVGFYFGLLARKENIIITTCEHSWLLANGDRLLLEVTQTQPPETFQSQNIHYILHIYGPDSSEG